MCRGVRLNSIHRSTHTKHSQNGKDYHLYRLYLERSRGQSSVRSLTADISVGNPRRPALVSWSPVFAWPPPGWHSTGSTAPTELRTGGVKIGG